MYESVALYLALYLALGLVVGLMAGLLGIGGGAIMVPAYVWLFSVQGNYSQDIMHLALGTSMASIVVTSFSSMRAHRANGYVNWLVVRSMSIGVVSGAFVLSFFTSILSEQVLTTFFAIFMTFVAFRMFFNFKSNSEPKTLPNGYTLGLAGFGIGGVSSLVSIGGGSLTVPFLLNKNVNVKTAIGTSAAIGLPLSLAGTLGYIFSGVGELPTSDYTLGYVYWPAVISVSTASFVTAPIGAKLAHRLPVSVLKKCFAILLILISVKMIMSVG